MRIGLLGATGPTGLRLVQQALDAGHQVIALVRNPDKLAHIEHEGLSKIKVDIFSADDLQKAFTENKVEVVMSCLGGRPKVPWAVETLYSDTVKSMTEAMRASGVKRFICCLAALQKREGGESFMLRMFSGYVIKTILDDMARMESYLFESCQDLDFTILRPTGLTNDALSSTEPILLPDRQFNQDDSHRIPRANVAQLMLLAMSEDRWFKQAVYTSMPHNFQRGSSNN